MSANRQANSLKILLILTVSLSTAHCFEWLKCPSKIDGYKTVKPVIDAYTEYTEIVREGFIGGRTSVGYNRYQNVGKSVLVVYESTNVEKAVPHDVLFSRYINELKVVSRVAELEGQVAFEGFDYATYMNPKTGKERFIGYLKFDKVGSNFVQIPDEDGSFTDSPADSAFIQKFISNTLWAKLGNLKNIGRALARYHNAGIVHCNVTPMSIIYDNEIKNYANSYKFHAFGNAIIVDEKEDRKCFRGRYEGEANFYFIPDYLQKEQTFPAYVNDTWSFSMLCLDLLLIHFAEDFPRYHGNEFLKQKEEYAYKGSPQKPVLQKNKIRRALLTGFKKHISTALGVNAANNVIQYNGYMYVFLELIDYFLSYTLNTNLKQIPNMKTVVQDLESLQYLYSNIGSYNTLITNKRGKTIINKSFGDRVNYNYVYNMAKDENFFQFVKREGAIKKADTSEELDTNEMPVDSQVNKIVIDKPVSKEVIKSTVQSKVKVVDPNQQKSAKGGPSEYETLVAEFIDFSQLRFFIVADYLESKKPACAAKDVPVYSETAYKSPYQAEALKPKMKVSFDLFCYASEDKPGAGIQQKYVTWNQ